MTRMAYNLIKMWGALTCICIMSYTIHIMLALYLWRLSGLLFQKCSYFCIKCDTYSSSLLATIAADINLGIFHICSLGFSKRSSSFFCWKLSHCSHAVEDNHGLYLGISLKNWSRSNVWRYGDTNGVQI